MNSLARALAYCILVLPSAFVWTASEDVTRSSGALTVALFVLLYGTSLLLAILVHEVGHALVGIANGWRIKYIAVFPVAYYPGAKRFRVWRNPVGDIGGAVSIAVTPNNSSYRLAAFAAGGPVANLLLSTSLLAVTNVMPHRTMQNVLGSFAMVSLLLGVGNIIPWRSRKGFRSDGMVLAKIANRAMSRKVA